MKKAGGEASQLLHTKCLDCMVAPTPGEYQSQFRELTALNPSVAAYFDEIEPKERWLVHAMEERRMADIAEGNIPINRWGMTTTNSAEIMNSLTAPTRNGTTPTGEDGPVRVISYTMAALAEFAIDERRRAVEADPNEFLNPWAKGQFAENVHKSEPLEAFHKGGFKYAVRVPGTAWDGRAAWDVDLKKRTCELMCWQVRLPSGSA